MGPGRSDRVHRETGNVCVSHTCCGPEPPSTTQFRSVISFGVRGASLLRVVGPDTRRLARQSVLTVQAVASGVSGTSANFDNHCVS